MSARGQVANKRSTFSFHNYIKLSRPLLLYDRCASCCFLVVVVSCQEIGKTWITRTSYNLFVSCMKHDTYDHPWL